MKTHGVAVIAVVAMASAAHAASNGDTDQQCYASAMNGFIAQKQPLLSALPMTVENRIAIRRLEEQYCIQTTQCATASMPKESVALASGPVFDSCLQDEAEEVYDLVPRKD